MSGDTVGTSSAAAPSSADVASSPPDSAAERQAASESVAGDADSPCDIASAEMVEEAFGVPAGDGALVAISCRYSLEGGPGQWVDVVRLGDAVDWDSIRARYEEQRGGVDDVDGIGDAAFHPLDHGERDLVFSVGDDVFAVLGYGGPTEETLSALGTGVAELARLIAASR